MSVSSAAPPAGAYPDDLRRRVDAYLQELTFSDQPDVAGLVEAMRYSLLAGGSRQVNGVDHAVCRAQQQYVTAAGLLALGRGSLTWSSVRQVLNQGWLQSTPFVMEHDLIARLAHTELGQGSGADGGLAPSPRYLG